MNMKKRVVRSVVMASVVSLTLWVSRGEAQTFQFAKAPTGEEEVAITRFLEECYKALLAQDLKPWLACFADDAKIDSKAANSIVDKKIYEGFMSRSFRYGNPISLSVKDAEITLRTPTEATITGIQALGLKNVPSSTDKHFWRLEKRGGKWLIVETKYQ